MGLNGNITPKGIGRYLRDPLHKDAIFLILANGFSAIIGFVFWIVTARYFSPEDVGLATTIISTMMLLCVSARLGFDISMVRFIPRSKNKRTIINTYLSITSFVSIALATVFILGIRFWSPNLVFVQRNVAYAVIFILATAATSIGYLQEHIFIALHKTYFNFFETILTGTRIILVVLLAGLGVIGIFSAWGISIGIAVLGATVFLLRADPAYRPIPMVSITVLKETFKFSVGNYLAEGLKELPKWIMPLIINRILSPEMSAFFFMAWTVAGILYLISYAMSFSLLSHGSFEPSKLKTETVKAAKFIFILLIPATIIFFFFGDRLLSFFGVEYSQNSFHLLRLLSLASIPLAVNTIYITLKRLQMKIKPLFYIHGFIAVVTIAGSAVLMDIIGINGIGVAWLAANTAVALFLIPMLWKTIRVDNNLV